MKRILNFMLLSLLLSGMYSCKQDEVAAPNPVDGLTILPGKNRAMVEFVAPGDARTGKIFYGNGKFHSFEVVQPGEKQTILVSHLQEGEQILRVVTINADGKISDPKGGYVTVYGENYQSRLSNRKLLSQKTLSPTSIRMTFGEVGQDEVGTRVYFTNTQGKSDSITVDQAQSSFTVENIDLSKAYYFSSVFKPTGNFIDEFVSSRTDAKEAAMKNLEKDIWRIEAVSDESGTGKGSHLIDNDSRSGWISQNTPAPHWVTVDMQTEKKFNGIKVLQVPDPGENGFARNYKFEVSLDNKEWMMVSEGKLKENAYIQSIKLKDYAVARYFKLTITDNYKEGTVAQLAEIDLFNEINVSGENGLTMPKLKNNKAPFKGDGSDRFPTVGAGRMQQVAEWTHNANANITLDISTKLMSLWSCAVWGMPDVTNGKVYQTLHLLPGTYVATFDMAHTSNPKSVDVLGTVASGTTLPDYTVAKTSPQTLVYTDAVAHQQSVVNLVFTIHKEGDVSIGFVYNTHNIYPELIWSDMYIRGVDLSTK